MKNRSMVLQALVSLVLVFGPVVPAPIVGASSTFSYTPDEESVTHAPVDTASAHLAAILNATEG